jgi:hypothetical protein
VGGGAAATFFLQATPERPSANTAMTLNILTFMFLFPLKNARVAWPRFRRCRDCVAQALWDTPDIIV